MIVLIASWLNYFFLFFWLKLLQLLVLALEKPAQDVQSVVDDCGERMYNYGVDVLELGFDEGLSGIIDDLTCLSFLFLISSSCCSCKASQIYFASHILKVGRWNVSSSRFTSNGPSPAAPHGFLAHVFLQVNTLL